MKDSLAVEKAHISKVYEICDNNVSRAAKIMGISNNTLKSKINQ